MVAPRAPGVVSRTNWPILAALRFALAWIVLSCHMPWFSPDYIAWARGLESFGGKAAVASPMTPTRYTAGAGA